MNVGYAHIKGHSKMRCTSCVIDLDTLENTEVGLEPGIGTGLGSENSDDITNSCPSNNQQDLVGVRVM